MSFLTENQYPCRYLLLLAKYDSSALDCYKIKKNL